MKKTLIMIAMVFGMACPLVAKDHPTLMLTRKGVSEMKSVRGQVPLFDASVDAMLVEAEAALERPLCVPQPQDGGGGYSHEMHKLNYYEMNLFGEAWQLTGDRRYVQKTREILLAYCDLYPTLGYHPVVLSPVPGRVFWQTLNESVWLLHTSMAYDCVRDALSAKDRKRIENELLRPWAQFVMDGTEDNRANLATFNKMHNHGTWATAAVGMAGMAMDDMTLVKKALYGTDMTGRNGGFIMQLDHLFSPDGFFTEGAYYHRYAIWPFVMFATCISNYMPELDIFHYRDGILVRSLKQLLQQAYNGEFMHFNDAMEKSFAAQEILYALDIVYAADPSDKTLLSVARDVQKKVIVSDAGYAVARDIAKGEAQPMRYVSSLLHDGKDGKDGALAIMRSTREDLNSVVTMKATSHGLSHGHYDKLTLAYYDSDNEILTDYGSARFHNIEAKYKGHYTPQNKSYALQTIAHNTVVVDKRSHYDGVYKESMKHSPRIVRFQGNDDRLQYVCAVDSTAYKGVRMQRWVAYVDVPFLQQPLLVDLFKVDSDAGHCLDYPVHYNGHMISITAPYRRAISQMNAFGDAAGYQHLWVEAEGKTAGGCTSFTWMTGYKMYSLTTATSEGEEFYFLRTGAGDPDFNLRSEPAYLIRVPEASNHLFASCLETHGRYDVCLEQAANMVHSCTGVTVLRNDAQCVQVRYEFKEGSVTVTADPQSGEININY